MNWSRCSRVLVVCGLFIILLHGLAKAFGGGGAGTPTPVPRAAALRGAAQESCTPSGLLP
jgi:hypothetical protein